MTKRIKISQIAAIIGVVAVLIVMLTLTGYSSFFTTVKNDNSEGREFYVPEGVTLRWIADNLEEQGFIRSSTLFLIAGKVMVSEKEIMAGEYVFPPNRNLFDILLFFKYGKVNYRKVMIQPGYNLDKIAEILESQGLVDAVKFKELTKDRDLVDLLGTDVSDLEGFLYPDTYYFFKGSNPKKMVKKMVMRFKSAFTPDLEERASKLKMSEKDVITLASIIEREAVSDSDRPLISAVFHNRLRKKIPLQSDPTVIYALGKGFDGDLKKEHLRMKSPYNTYVNRGLPPGPIGSPSIESIRAALYPANVDYIYFVSKNDGTHQFSKNLAEHNRAVAVYQKPLALNKIISLNRGSEE